MSRPASVSLHFTSELPPGEALAQFAGHEVAVFGRLSRLEVTTSTTHEAFRRHKPGPAPASPPPLPLQPVPFQGCSSYSTDFVPHPVMRLESPPSPPQRPHCPFIGATSYKDDYKAKPLPSPPMIASPPPRPAAAFEGCSTTQDTYRGHVVKPCRPSLGIATLGDRFHVLIHGAEPMPASAKEVFTTVHDGQEWVCFLVYQGDAALASANQLLGQFQLGPLPPTPAGSLKIQVTFYLDQDGVVFAKAQDTASGQQYQWRLQQQ